MNIDGDKSYTLNAEMKKERVKNAHKYSPSIEITLPNKQPYTVSGMFMYDGIRKFDVELDMNRITAKPVKASGIEKWATSWENPVVSEQVRHKSGCAVTEAG